MKTLHLFILVCSATLLGGSAAAAAPAPEPPLVALRFVAAADAATAIHERLGTKAGEAVSRVDERLNTITLDSNHPQAAIVRAFLTRLDHRTNVSR